MKYTFHYSSPVGGILIAADEDALTGLWFDGQKYYADAPEEAHRDETLREAAHPVLAQAENWLDLYFSGREPGFTPPLRFHATPFREAVWNILLTIPYGETVTYGEIAGKIAEERGTGRMSAQAVGGAVGHNPISIIVPCHRVVGSDGSLTGYAAGTDIKKKLLTLENADHWLKERKKRDILFLQYRSMRESGRKKSPETGSLQK